MALRKTAAKKSLAGNPSRRKKRPALPPLVLVDVPRAPPGMAAVGRRVWDKVARHFVELGQLSDLDTEALEQYCRAWEIYETYLPVVIDPKQATFVTDSGYRQEDPRVRLWQAAVRQCQYFQRQFGLTPLARGQIDLAAIESSSADAISAFDRK